MLKLGDVFLDDKGDVVYVPNRERPPFHAGTPVELRNMLINAVLKVVKDREGVGSKIVVYPQVTCLYPKRHHHEKGEPYTDSEILLSRSQHPFDPMEPQSRSKSRGTRQQVDSSHRPQRGGARVGAAVQQPARVRRPLSRRKRD